MSPDLLRENHAGAFYGPQAVRAMTQAFDLAWAEIEHHFEPEHPLQAQLFRLRLAHAILEAAKPNSLNAADIKDEALAIVALKRPGTDLNLQR